jgi:hypothetical protein
MKQLAPEIAEVMIIEHGRSTFLERLSDPYWFQAFGCVLGFDWQVQAVAAEDTDDDRKRANSETTFLQETFAFFEGIKPGDMAAIDKKYRARQSR